MKFAHVSCALLALATTPADAITRDPGTQGKQNVVEYQLRALTVRDGSREPIASICESACNLRLASATGPKPKYCVRKDGAFRVHAEFRLVDGEIVRPEESFVRLTVPACFRNLTGYRPWTSKSYTTFAATRVLSACPALAASSRFANISS